MKLGLAQQMSKSFPDDQSQPSQTRAMLPAGSEGHLEDLESIPRSKSSLFTTFKFPSLPVATYFGSNPSLNDLGVSFNHFTGEVSGFTLCFWQKIPLKSSSLHLDASRYSGTDGVFPHL